jgi:hypothetical protein
VIIKGTKYKVNAIVHIGFDDNDDPLFWKILKILVIQRNLSTIKFLCQSLPTVGFNKHFQCYEVGVVEDDAAMRIFLQNDFSCRIPKNICRPYGKLTGPRYICTRYDLGTTS